MTKKVKEFIAKAVPRKSDTFQSLFIINSGRAYNGFFGRNGYNDIILIGRAPNSDELELITEHSDVIWFQGAFSDGNIEISNNTGIISIWWLKPVKLTSVLSTTQFVQGGQK